MSTVMKMFGLAYHAARRLSRRLRMLMLMPLFGSHGKRFWFDPDGSYTFASIHVGDDVSLGQRPTLMAALSEIRIGDGVMFGPEVVIIGGGHNTQPVGRRMVDVHEKSGNEDLGVIIDDDVWVGTRAVILRGVRVHRGAIVAAGALVTKSVPPYAVVAGNPATVVRFRWDVDTILRHESQLYPEAERLPAGLLREAQETMAMWPPTRSQVAPGRPARA